MSNAEANYSEFNTVPAWTRAVWSADGKHLVNTDDPFKWGGDADPPAIGDRVHVYMNGLGAGTVLGYFVEYGWFGLLVKLDKSPEWRRKQLKANGKDANAPAHIFGIDLKPLKRQAGATPDAAAKGA